MLLRLQKQKNCPASNKHSKKVTKGRQITERMFLRPQIKVRKSQRDDRPQAGGEAKRNPCYVSRLRRSAEGTTDSSLPPFRGLGSPSHIKQGLYPCLWSFSPFRGSSGAHKSKGLSNHGSNTTPSLRYSPNV